MAARGTVAQAVAHVAVAHEALRGAQAAEKLAPTKVEYLCSGLPEQRRSSSQHPRSARSPGRRSADFMRLRPSL
jgi:hypothetical protein